MAIQLIKQIRMAGQWTNRWNSEMNTLYSGELCVDKVGQLLKISETLFPSFGLWLITPFAFQIKSSESEHLTALN